MKHHFFIVLLTPIFLMVAAYASEYVPGMTCSEVGDFAQTVLIQKQLGETLEEQITGLRQSLGGEYEPSRIALKKIIRTIYENKLFSKGRPEDVNFAFKSSCQLIEAQGE